MESLQAVNEKQAATYLSLSVQTLRNWRCQGCGPRYFRISNRAIRYRVGDLEEFLQSHAINPEIQ